MGGCWFGSCPATGPVFSTSVASRVTVRWPRRRSGGPCSTTATTSSTASRPPRPRRCARSWNAPPSPSRSACTSTCPRARSSTAWLQATPCGAARHGSGSCSPAASSTPPASARSPWPCADSNDPTPTTVSTPPSSERANVEREKRHVEVIQSDDAMAWLNAYLPAHEAAAIATRLRKAAKAARAAGDDRTQPQLEADLLTEWALHSDDSQAARGQGLAIDIAVTLDAKVAAGAEPGHAEAADGSWKSPPNGCSTRPSPATASGTSCSSSRTPAARWPTRAAASANPQPWGGRSPPARP